MNMEQWHQLSFGCFWDDKRRTPQKITWLFNKDVYPKTYDQHLHQVANHKVPEDWKKNLYKKTSQQEGVAFVQQGAVKLDEKLI